MFASLPAAFLMMLLLAGTSATAQTCPPPGEAEGRCIELTAEGTNEVPEVQISPGQPTTFRFDSDVRAGGMTLENREHFEVAPGRRLLTLEPSEKMRGAKSSMVTVCFADDAVPACANFRLVVHPAIGERQVEIFRHPRSVDSVQAELRKTREENSDLRAEIQRLHAERDRPEGLIGLFASGMVGEAGIPSQTITKRITKRESNTLRPRTVTTFRAPGRVAIELWLENPDAVKSWTPQGAVLVGPRGEVLDATFWPAEPIPSGEERRVWLEVMAPDARTEGTFTLKLWEADGQRTFVIGNVTFPALTVGLGL
ncbi:DUF2381 family protein [Archangium violaceum]|uniref:DUF2381 family protein n=1 Tax=Archangium violaceum TaxID=83451 RepID=UPI00193B411A|nr:DUF2381 family protein [Archangium violaceum]QRK09162.1 DUF2381 family protein [Archangium violaceum]